MKRFGVLAAVCVLIASATLTNGPAAAAERAVSCSTSRALFPNPLSTRYADPRWYDHNVVLTANHGELWAGYAYDGSRQNSYAAITWKRGQKHAAVLGKFSHPTGNSAGVVSMAGITAEHVVVAAIKHTHSENRYGMTWYQGRSHQLAARSSWVSVAPEGVADRGTIYGVVRSVYGGKSHYLIVRWAHRLAAPTVVRSLGVHRADVAVDARGDVVYDSYSGAVHARLADSGRTVTLADHDGAVNGFGLITAGGPFVVVSAEDGIERWALNPTLSGTVRASAPVVRHRAGIYYQPVIAGAGGALVFDGDRDDRWLRTASGKIKGLSSSRIGRQALDRDGVLALTSKSDARAHLVSCH